MHRCQSCQGGHQNNSGCLPASRETAEINEALTKGPMPAGQENRPTVQLVSETLGSSASVIETPQARHSKDCNSGNPPILGIERTGRMAAPQLGQHGAKWYSWCMSPPSARAFTSTE